jgi:hypothetical protein
VPSAAETSRDVSAGHSAVLQRMVQQIGQMAPNGSYCNAGPTTAVLLADELVDALEADADEFGDVSQGEALVVESSSDGCGEFAGVFVGVVGL